MMSRAARMLCKALKQTFSTATAATGRGHMTRSSISRVTPNSEASDRATPAMPLNMMATAIRPGSWMVAKEESGEGLDEDFVAALSPFESLGCATHGGASRLAR